MCSLAHWYIRILSGKYLHCWRMLTYADVCWRIASLRAALRLCSTRHWQSCFCQTTWKLMQYRTLDAFKDPIAQGNIKGYRNPKLNKSTLVGDGDEHPIKVHHRQVLVRLCLFKTALRAAVSYFLKLSLTETRIRSTCTSACTSRNRERTQKGAERYLPWWICGSVLSCSPNLTTFPRPLKWKWHR
jgi:hypothetical protein